MVHSTYCYGLNIVRQHVIADEIVGFLPAYFVAWLSEKKIKESKAEIDNMRSRVAFMMTLTTIFCIVILIQFAP